MLVVVIIAIIIATITYRKHEENQKLLRQDLDQSGAALDDLASSLEAAIPGVNPERFSDCYRASRKLETGPIVCSEGVRFSRENLADEQVTDDFVKIKPILGASEPLGMKEGTGSSQSQYFFAGTGYPNVSCTAYVSKERSIAGYSFRLECLGSGFDEFIYPERVSEH